MFETSILAKNLIKSYFEEVGNEDTPILDKFDKLIGKYLKGASCDACLTNLHGYLNEMWDKGLNEKYIREFIEELTKYIDESTASKINKGLKFTESLEESNRSLKESKDDLIQVTEDNPVFPYWVYDTHRKTLNDIFDICFYKKKFDIFVTDIGNGDKVEIYIVNDDMTVILTKETANIIIHKINKNNEYLTNLSYASYYKTSSEVDGYIDKKWYGQFLKDFLDVVYKY